MNAQTKEKIDRAIECACKKATHNDLNINLNLCKLPLMQTTSRLRMMVSNTC
jgi:hypothetical protein